MTPAAELWAAVVANCATGRGYGMTLMHHPRASFTNVTTLNNAEVRNLTGDKWTVVSNRDGSVQFATADEAVRAALRIVAPSTEPNVSC